MVRITLSRTEMSRWVRSFHMRPSCTWRRPSPRCWDDGGVPSSLGDPAAVRPDRRAYSVWAVALGVYVLAVFHRSSLAVAGLAATERFDISASQLATFTMLQLLVYAGMQIPVGLLVDRFGPRAVLATGAVTLTLAQTGF